MKQAIYNGKSETKSRMINICCSIFTGKTPKYDFENENFIVIGQKNNQKGVINIEEPKYVTKEFHDSNPKDLFLKKGDIVLNSLGGGSVGRIGYFDIDNEDILTDGHPIVFRVNNNNYSRYVFYALYNEQKQFEDMAVGSTNQCFLNISDVIHFEINLPSYSTQKTIADFLDIKCSQIDSLLSKIQEQIDTLDQYKKSVITEAVTKGLNLNTQFKETDSDYFKEIPNNWDFKDIKYVFEIVKRIAGKEGYDILSVTQKGLKIKDISSNEGQIAESYANYQFVYPDDYVMNHMDLLTGWVDCSSMFGVTSPDYRVFKLRNNLYNKNYFKYLMQLCYFNKIFYSLGQGVSNLGRWRLQTSSFNNFKIPVPNIEEQNQISDYLDNKCSQIDSIISNKKKQLETLEQYKKSLIYEYVTGKKEVA